MLSIGRLGGNADPAGYYIEVIATGVEDYYVSGHEAPGQWVGKGAPRLGLAGGVVPDDLRAVLEGNDPRNGERLVGWHKRPGYDLTLSAPKSVSLLWGLGDRATADAVVAAHEQAVDAAIAYLEDAACFVRRGRGGRIRMPGVGLVGAAFRHRTSRAGDPNLHSHVVVANMTEAPDGGWSSLFSQAVYRHARTAGFVYQAVLRHGLSTDLNVAFGPSTKGVREIEGVPTRVREAFSKRRVEIEAAMAAHGTHSRRGAQVATLDTRPAKQAGVSEAALRRDWCAQARALGFDVKHIGRRHERPRGVAVGELGVSLTDHDATFDRRDVVRAVADAAVDGLPYRQIGAGADRFLDSDGAVAVCPGRWTTPGMLAVEAEALRLAHPDNRVVQATPTALVDEAVAARPSLSAEQRRAVVAMTTSRDPVVMVAGQAGSGKTFALDGARAAWQAGGHQVIGAALAARAARQLQVGSGIPSRTVAALLSDVDAGRHVLGPQSVVVLDEAGMVGTRDLHRLLRRTSAAQAKLVLVGDHRQLAEISAGGLFASLTRRLGSVELTENRRQRDGVQRGIARALRDRDIERAVLRLSRSGHLSTDDNADALRHRMARDWLLEQRAGQHAVMLALHRSDVADLNRRARAGLRTSGQLGEVVLQMLGVEFAVGDRVMTLRNQRSLGLLNGTQATVRDRTRTGLVVATDDGRSVEVPFEYMAAGHLTHAYALTVHKSQVMTCDVALVLADDTLYAEAGYTAMTRGRVRNHLYAVTAPGCEQPLAELSRCALPRRRRSPTSATRRQYSKHVPAAHSNRAFVE